MLQIGSVHAHQPHSQHHQSGQQAQTSPQGQAQVGPGGVSVGAAAAPSAGGPGSAPGVTSRPGGMFCYHCPPGLPTPRLPPTLEYSFAPTHPCK